MTTQEPTKLAQNLRAIKERLETVNPAVDYNLGTRISELLKELIDYFEKIEHPE
jgi:hypothetical protein